MFGRKAIDRRPLAFCVPCSEKTPHRYERLAVNGRLTSRAVCLVCDNDSRKVIIQEGTAGSAQ
jgi:hypothetical protein